jgi:hypothetical protein
MPCFLFRREASGAFALARNWPSINGGGYWVDFDNDGDLDLLHAADGKSRLHRNTGGELKDVTQSSIGRIGNLGCPIWADFDSDGDPDLLAPDWDHRIRLLRNDIALGNHWLQVRLRGTPPNTQAVGARVKLTAAGRTQIRDVLLSTSSACPLTACFGLGEATRVDALEVRWPTGRIERIEGLQADRVVMIEEKKPQADGR